MKKGYTECDDVIAQSHKDFSYLAGDGILRIRRYFCKISYRSQMTINNAQILKNILIKSNFPMENRILGKMDSNSLYLDVSLPIEKGYF